MQNLEATIIIPAFNESDRLEQGFSRLETAAHEGRLDFASTEVIFVDDGSSDETSEVASKIASRLPHGSVVIQPQNFGKGAAVRAGVRAARAPRLVFTDADLAIDPRQLPSLLSALDAAPVAVGSRAIRGHIDYGTWLRTRAGRTFNLIVRRLSAIDLRDTQCGFKGARTAHAKILLHWTTIQGFAFDVEFLARARSLNWEIAEVPVSWRDVPGSHVDVARHSLAMFTDLVHARLRSRSLPNLYGLEGLDLGGLDALAAACEGTSLEAAPVITDRLGRVSVLAALHSDAEASEVLGALATTFGGAIRPFSVNELRSAVRVEPALRSRG